MFLLQKGESNMFSTHKKNRKHSFKLISTIALSMFCQQAYSSHASATSSLQPTPSNIQPPRKVSFHETPEIKTYQPDEKFITKHLSTKDLPQTSRTLTQQEVGAKVLLRSSKGDHQPLTASNLTKLQESLGVYTDQTSLDISTKAVCSKETRTDDEQQEPATISPIESLIGNRNQSLSAAISPTEKLSCCHQ